MATGYNILLAGALIAVVCATATAMTKRQGDAWTYYRFDGRGFSAGPPTDGGPFVALRDGVAPVLLTQAAKIEATALPPGKGAVAGICFMQHAGGKLAGGAGFTPSPDTPIRITGNGGSTLISSSADGYFVALLDAGEYEIMAGPARTHVRVEKGKTTLTALRTGKRMVD
ncbi:MAG: hypothetical protein HYV06_10835 [Deltaproteobacteria bacterium]|nr:hypothetical protein [Deltaproteobacteria bacterium]